MFKAAVATLKKPKTKNTLLYEFYIVYAYLYSMYKLHSTTTLDTLNVTNSISLAESILILNCACNVTSTTALNVNSTYFCHSSWKNWAFMSLHYCNNYHLLSSFSSKFQYIHDIISLQICWDAKYTQKGSSESNLGWWHL